MGAMENAGAEYHLTPKQVLLRILSVVVCGLGASNCVYSLTMRVADADTILVTIVWFSGLAAVVFALAGYAISCDPGMNKGYLPVAIAAVAVVAVAFFVLTELYLTDLACILACFGGMFLEAAVLVVYHFVLKAEDPEAL